MPFTPQQFVATARQLGNGRAYILDTTGPDSYDCSGLIYRTLVNLGLYNGRRFSTRDWVTLSSHIAFSVSPPAVGDVVLWAARHIGIVTGPDTFYSAYSPARGILDTSISQFPGTPQYYRLDAYAPTILVGSHGGVPVPVHIPTPVTPTPAPAPQASTDWTDMATEAQIEAVFRKVLAEDRMVERADMLEQAGKANNAVIAAIAGVPGVTVDHLLATVPEGGSTVWQTLRDARTISRRLEVAWRKFVNLPPV